MAGDTCTGNILIRLELAIMIWLPLLKHFLLPAETVLYIEENRRVCRINL